MDGTRPPRRAGRRYKTLAELPQGWQETVLNVMADGAGTVEARVAIGQCKDLHYRWMAKPAEGEEDPFAEYREVFEEGHDLSQVFWERVGRTNLRNEAFNHVLWYMNMKNRFRKCGGEHWQDKVETEISDPGRDAMVKKIISFGGAKIEIT